MNDELEMPLRAAFHRDGLPVAPSTLIDTLDAVVAVPVGPGSAARRGPGRRSWGVLAVAAVLVVGGAIALSVGNRSPEPAPSPPPSASPAPSAASGMRLTYEPQWTADVPFDADNLAAIVRIAQARVDATGAVGVVVSTEDERRVVVDIPSGLDPQPIRELVGVTGSVAFVPVSLEQAVIGQHLDRTAFPPLIDASGIEGASRETDQTGLPGLLIRLDDAAALAFSDYTAAHIGEWFAISIDDVVVSAPMINDRIPGGEVLISFGGLPGQRPDLDALVAVIQNGPLPLPLVEVSSGPAHSPTASAATPSG